MTIEEMTFPVILAILMLLLSISIERDEKRKEKKMHTRRFNPLIINDNGEKRYFSWLGKDPVDRIRSEEKPRQLNGFSGPLCIELRQESGMKPKFNLPTNISGEVVYELSEDRQLKWRLLGGRGNGPSDQVLVLVRN